MLKEFREFILRGNVIDLAIAVIIGVAFGAVVTSLVNDIFTPLIAAIVGKPSFDDIVINLGDTPIKVGLFLNALFSFVTTLPRKLTRSPFTCGLGVRLPLRPLRTRFSKTTSFTESGRERMPSSVAVVPGALASVIGLPGEPPERRLTLSEKVPPSRQPVWPALSRPSR